MIKKNQLGAVIVEFALAALVFFTVFFAVIEFSRLVLAFNTISEATRLAARIASTCPINPDQSINIQSQIQNLVQSSGLVANLKGNPSWLKLNYIDNTGSNCTDSSQCLLVQASIPDLQFHSLLIPTLPFDFKNSYTSTAIRESMQDVLGGNCS